MLHVMANPLLVNILDRKLVLDYGCPKKRKDGMPKKHGPKKGEKGVIMSEKIISING